MKLDAWVTKVVEAAKAAGEPVSRKFVMADLAKAAGVNFQTISQAERGARMGLYEKALSVSQATGWAVTVIELCDPNPEDTLGRIRNVL